MIYKSLQDCVQDLHNTKQLIKIPFEVDADLEMAEIHRRYYDAKGPAILFEKVKNSPFRALSNLYGTPARTDFLFRSTIKKVKKIIELKAHPDNLFKNPFRYLDTPLTAFKALPSRNWLKPASMYGETTIDKLPLLKSWPLDAGGFVTLPQVFSLPPGSKNIMESNLGMYRIQLSGNAYRLNEEIGLHYQIHRGIGVHHQLYNQSDEEFKVSIFVGGLPSHALSAIFPLPEGLSELTFAGMLAGRKFGYYRYDGWIVSADADFCILGTVQKKDLKPEGPFGDHLGYYSLEHPFPYMKIHKVFHKKDPIWHFTVVGRPPQEDSSFGYLIHQLVEALTPGEFPGLKQIHAVDVSGVHPLLLAIGSERYMPFRDKKPEEILAIANRIIGSGQTSLAKYLFIADGNDQPLLDTYDFSNYFRHILERVDWRRDIHFQTNTTIDTLDYSGTGLNSGSKVIIACAGPSIRNLKNNLPTDFVLSKKWPSVKPMDNGILCIEGPKYTDLSTEQEIITELIKELETKNTEGFPLIVLCDDVDFTIANWANFLWVSFTRSNPSHDIRGVGEQYTYKHWGCTGSLIIDARKKPHHAPELEKDLKTTLKVDKLFSKGGPLYGTIPTSI